MYTGIQHAFISEKVAIDVAQRWLGIIEDQPGAVNRGRCRSVLSITGAAALDVGPILRARLGLLAHR